MAHVIHGLEGVEVPNKKFKIGQPVAMMDFSAMNGMPSVTWFVVIGISFRRNRGWHYQICDDWYSEHQLKSTADVVEAMKVYRQKAMDRFSEILTEVGEVELKYEKILVDAALDSMSRA